MCRSHYQRLACGSLAVVLLLLAVPQVKAGIVIQANYEDSSSEGFYDQTSYNGSTLGAARRNAFEYALNIWGNALAPSYAGQTITIDAEFNPLGGDASSATLAQAGTETFRAVNGSTPLIFTDALANHVQGVDIDPGESEGFATFNSDIGGSALPTQSWYYGTDNNAGANEIDFVSTALHEIGHVLGFAGLMQSDGSYFDFSSTSLELYNQYDYYVIRTSDGAVLRNLSEAERATAITNDDISWGGAAGIAANGGVAPKLYAPSSWASGSSYSHLDESTFQYELMSPSYTVGTQHEISALTMGMMVDMGWDSALPEPGTLAVWSILAITAGLTRRRRGDFQFLDA